MSTTKKYFLWTKEGNAVNWSRYFVIKINLSKHLIKTIHWELNIKTKQTNLTLNDIGIMFYQTVTTTYTFKKSLMCSSTFEKVWRIDKEKHKILVVYNGVFLKKSASSQSKYKEKPVLWCMHYFTLYNIYKNQEINVGVIKDSSLKCSAAKKKPSRRFGRKLRAKEKIICPPEHP